MPWIEVDGEAVHVNTGGSNKPVTDEDRKMIKSVLDRCGHPRRDHGLFSGCKHCECGHDQS